LAAALVLGVLAAVMELAVSAQEVVAVLEVLVERVSAVGAAVALLAVQVL
jgi:hypothetical protein